MKSIIVLLVVVSVANTAPQPKKPFHEHYDDFTNIILDRISDDINNLIVQYYEFEEFQRGLEYISSNEFYNLHDELEHLPEFVAVVQFLEGHNIDITYFIDMINSAFDGTVTRKARQVISGRDLSAFTQDCIELFPREDLIALYNSIYEEDESFRHAMDDFDSEEWVEIFNALLENETFKAEASTLLEYGIQIDVIFNQMKAVFGKF